MDALEVETSIAAGEQALQARLRCARETAGTLEAHDAEKGLCTRRLPMGLAAMKVSLAQRGTGAGGPAVTQADGVFLPREQKLRGRDACARFGTCAVPRTGDRTPGEQGIGPLDEAVNLPARCDSSFLHAWLTGCAVEPPFQARAGGLGQLWALAVAERVVMAGAKAAAQADEACAAPRPLAPAHTEGDIWVVSVDGTGVPLIQAEAGQRTATLGPGEQRQRKQAALVGVRDTGEPTPRAPAAGRDPRRGPPSPAGATCGQPGAHAAGGDGADPGRRRAPGPAAPPALGHRLAGALGRWRLAPQRCTPWTRVTCVLASRHVVGSRWAAAHAWCGAASQAGQYWVPHQRTEMRRGRVGYVSGGWRPILTTPRLRQSGRQPRATVLPCLHHHRRGGRTTRTWRGACPSGPAWWSRPAALGSSLAWRAQASAGAAPAQRPSSRGARARRALPMRSGPTGGSMPARCDSASTVARHNTGQRRASSVSPHSTQNGYALSGSSMSSSESFLHLTINVSIWHQT